jgi:hypothetical protein
MDSSNQLLKGQQSISQYFNANVDLDKPKPKRFYGINNAFFKYENLDNPRK